MKRHTDYVKSRIQNVTNLASKTYVSTVPRAAGTIPTPPYAVLHPSDGSDSVERLSGPAVTQHPRFTLWIVGTSYDSVAIVTENVKAQFVVAGVGVTPAIAGESCSRVWWDQPVPTDVNDTVTPALVFNIIELGFDTEPA